MFNKNLPTCIVIVGPTAVGKTAFAIQLAQHFNTQIISADSRQCFKELDIGVARPTLQELNAVPHYFIASHSIHQTITAATFEDYALEKCAAIFANNKFAIVVGGTGLYINAFCNGFDAVPEIPNNVRQEIIRNYELHGFAWLQQQLLQTDLLFTKTEGFTNPQRCMRALEVVLHTKQSILSYQQGVKKQRPFNIIYFGLEMPRNTLYGKINNRVNAMFNAGFLEEVKSLLPYQGLNALKTVGYNEVFAHLNGHTTLAEAQISMQQKTRQYAKRQITWFKKNALVNWLDATNTPKAFLDVLAYVG
jgi:tRNA dimethylallyltransferase